jgi:hypothetical protein
LATHTLTVTSDTILDSDGVAELCVDGCYASLQSARKSIKGACTKSDVIVHEDVAYPGLKPNQPLCIYAYIAIATFIVDNYMLAYQLLCKKDKYAAHLSLATAMILMEV